MKKRTVSKKTASRLYVTFGGFAVALVGTALWAIFAPAPGYLIFLPKLLFPAATFCTVAAVITFLRRDPDAPTRWKDLARPVLAFVTVMSSMLSALHPLWALGGVLGAGAATWVGLAGGWWDGSIYKGDAAEITEDAVPKGIEETSSEERTD